MAIKFDTVLLDAYGEEMLIEGKPGQFVQLTLARAAVTAISAAIPADQGEDARLKVERSGVAAQVVAAEKAKKAISLPAEDVAMLKERIAACFTNAILVGAAWAILDPLPTADEAS